MTSCAPGMAGRQRVWIAVAVVALAGCGSTPADGTPVTSAPAAGPSVVTEPAEGQADISAATSPPPPTVPTASADTPSPVPVLTGSVTFTLALRNPTTSAAAAAEARTIEQYLRLFGVVVDDFDTDATRISFDVTERDVDVVDRALRADEAGLYPVLQAAFSTGDVVPGDPLGDLTYTGDQLYATSATGELMLLGFKATSFEVFDSATVTPGDPAVTLTVGDDGTDAINVAFAPCFELDASCPTGQLAFVVGSLVVTAPVVHALPGDEIEITGGFTAAEAETLAVLVGWHSTPREWDVSWS